MGSTKEIRFYCDRCGALYATSGEDGKLPPRNQVYLAMVSLEQHASPYHIEGVTMSHYDHVGDRIVTGISGACAQVCQSCFREFASAERRMREWWRSGKKQIAASEPLAAIQATRMSPRIAAAAAVTRSRRGRG